MNNKAKARYNSRLSDESDVVPLRQDVDGIDEIPQQQQPSNASLIDHAIKEEAAIQHKQSMVKTSAVNLFWVLMWYTFATVLSIYNKWMFSENHYNFHYPLFVTTFHMIVQFVCSGSTLLVVPKLRPKKRPSSKDYMYKVFPCALATALDIGLSNLSLKTITLSFYTMCKSSTLAFVLIFAFLFKLEKPTWKLVTIIVIITVGVVLMVANETEFDVVGFMQVMSAAVCGGLRWSLTEVLLRRESMGLTNPFASIFFLAPAQGIILFVISGLVEGYITIFNSAFFISFAEGLNTIAIILAGGSLAFCMIVSEFFLIKRTSVVTLSVCGIFKEVATIFISMLVFGDVLTIVNTIGLCITLFGIGLYNWFKFNIVSARTRKEAAELENERILAIAEDNERNREDDAMSDDIEDDGFNIGRRSGGSFDSDGFRRTAFYSTVAESTPFLLVDGGLTSAFNRSSHDEDGDEDDSLHSNNDEETGNHRRHHTDNNNNNRFSNERYELH